MRFNKGLVAAALLASTSAFAGLLDEGFNDVSTLAGKGWVQNNLSTAGGTTGWFQGNSGVFPAAAGAADSYIGANFENAPFGGSISNWLMSPSLSFSGPVTLNFALRLLGDSFRDTVEVYYHALGTTNVGDFALVDSYSSTSDTGWMQESLSIGGAGANVGRFAFRYVVADTSLDGNYIGIDSVSVVPEPISLALVAMALTGLAVTRRRA